MNFPFISKINLEDLVGKEITLHVPQESFCGKIYSSGNGKYELLYYDSSKSTINIVELNSSFLIKRINKNHFGLYGSYQHFPCLPEIVSEEEYKKRKDFLNDSNPKT